MKVKSVTLLFVLLSAAVFAQDSLRTVCIAPFKVLPVADEFLRAMAPYEPPARAEKFRNIRKALEDKNFQREVEQDESLNYLLHDTIALSMLKGSEQTNVIPPEAWANLDVRLLPGDDPKEFLATIRHVVNDPNAPVRQILEG